MENRKKRTIINLGILIVEFIFLALFLDREQTIMYESLIFIRASLVARFVVLPMTYVTVTYLIMGFLSIDFLSNKGVNRYLTIIGRIVLGIIFIGYLLFFLNVIGFIPYLFRFIPISSIYILDFVWKSTYKIPYLLIWVLVGVIASISTSNWSTKKTNL